MPALFTAQGGRGGGGGSYRGATRLRLVSISLGLTANGTPRQDASCGAKVSLAPPRGPAAGWSSTDLPSSQSWSCFIFQPEVISQPAWLWKCSCGLEPAATLSHQPCSISHNVILIQQPDTEPFLCTRDDLRVNSRTMGYYSPR